MAKTALLDLMAGFSAAKQKVIRESCTKPVCKPIQAFLFMGRVFLFPRLERLVRPVSLQGQTSNKTAGELSPALSV